MNIRWREHPVVRQALQGFLLVMFLAVAAYLFALLAPSESLLELIARANSTRTSIALTSRALMGPFPTPTGPTRTPFPTPTITATPTATSTRTPTPTPFRYFIDTATPRTLVPPSDLNPTSIAPTVPPSQPTNPPQVTRPPRPTNPPHPTKAPKPTKVPRPTKTPKK